MKSLDIISAALQLSDDGCFLLFVDYIYSFQEI